LRATQLLAALSGGFAGEQEGASEGAREGQHEVTLLAPAAPGEPAVPGVRRETYRRGPSAWLGAPARLLRGWPVQAIPFQQRDLARHLRRLAPLHDVVVLQLVRLASHLRDLGDRPVVADLIDCLSLNVRTRAAVAPAWQRPALAVEARRVAAAERGLIAAARRALVVCERDRRELAALAPELAGRIVVVPVAMPPPRPSSSPCAPPAGGPPTVMLTGNLGYFPNRDAVEWWLREPWPALRRAVPDLRLVVAGDRPSAAMRRRIERAGGALVARPDDLHALLAGGTLAVAPLRCGSGVPLKVLDAWSVDVPVVASPFAAEGAGAVVGRDLLVAESGPEWASQVQRLLGDAGLRARLAAAGRACIAAFSADRVHRELLAQVTAAAAG
jgi:glycosyltransferase involved in cell wall biosynthesis